MKEKISRIELLKGLPHDMQVEIVENMARKDFTESEKASIQNLLRKEFEKNTNQGKRNDMPKIDVDHMVDPKAIGQKPEGGNNPRYEEIPKERELKKPKGIEGRTLGDIAKEAGRTDEKIGAILGESDEQVRKRDKVFDNIDDKTKEDLDSGKKSLNSAYQKTVATQNKLVKAPPLPKGKFNHIVQDPGWDFDNKNIGGAGKSGASFQYKTMKTIDIAKIPIQSIAADDAILYMWTTNQHLITGSMLLKDFMEIAHGMNPKDIEVFGKIKVQSDALSVMICHGFTPKHIITWHKDKKEGWGGYSFNNVTEHLIIGVRGKGVKPFGLTEKTMVSTIWKKDHSTKPEEVWSLIEKCVATQNWDNKRLEMNCRDPRKDWQPHGDQITDKDVEAWKKL